MDVLGEAVFFIGVGAKIRGIMLPKVMGIDGSSRESYKREFLAPDASLKCMSCIYHCEEGV